MQDVKRQRLGQLRQQSQGARRSPSLFRGILGRQRHGYNFARELVGVVQYLVTALEVMPMKEPTMIHVMVRLMYETSKCKKKEPNVKMVSWCYDKVDNSFPRQGASSCFYCGKPGHIACFCYKPKNKERKNVKNAKDDDDYVFVLHNGVQSKSTCK